MDWASFTSGVIVGLGIWAATAIVQDFTWWMNCRGRHVAK